MCGVQMCIRCEATLSLPEHISCWCVLCFFKNMANRQCLTMQAAGLPRNSPRKDWPLPVLKQILTESIQETPRQLLARELWCGIGSASEWWSFQAGYTSSTAAMSMVSTPTINPALQATYAVLTGSMHSTNSCKQYLPCKPHMLYPLAACIVLFLLQSMHSGRSWDHTPFLHSLQTAETEPHQQRLAASDHNLPVMAVQALTLIAQTLLWLNT